MTKEFDYEFEDLGLSFLGSDAQFGTFSGRATVRVYGHNIFGIERIVLFGQAKGDPDVELNVYRKHSEAELQDQCLRNAILQGLTNALEVVLEDHEEVVGDLPFDPVREYGTLRAEAL